MNFRNPRLVTTVILTLALFCTVCLAGMFEAKSMAKQPSALSGDNSRRSAANDLNTLKVKRYREGTTINDAHGYFIEDGSGAKFVMNHGGDRVELGGLLNLNLERVVRSLKGTDDPEKLLWSVSGTVTEFSGRNYLLISRAVIQSNNLPRLPETMLPRERDEQR